MHDKLPTSLRNYECGHSVRSCGGLLETRGDWDDSESERVAGRRRGRGECGVDCVGVGKAEVAFPTIVAVVASACDEKLR